MRFIFVCALFLLAVCGRVTRAQIPPPHSPFSLRITLNRTTLLPGELVGVGVCLKNESQTSQTLDWWPEPSHVNLRYRSKGGNLWNYYSVFIGCRLPVAGQSVPSPTRTFAPGEEVWEFLPIGFNEEVTFGKGTYEIEAVRSPESLNEIESPPQVITVIPPSDADIRALTIISSQLSYSFYNIENSPYFFYSPGFDLSAEEKERQRGQLNDLIIGSPHSRYAHYARRALIVLSVTPLLRNQLTHGEADKTVLLQAANSLEALAQTQPRDIAVVTYCIAGFIRLAQNQTPESIEAFGRARHLSPGENMNARITSLIEWRQLFARY